MATVESKKKAAAADPKQEEAPKEEKREIPADYYYPANHLETVLPDSSISRACVDFQFHNILSFLYFLLS